jgi:DNA-binding protein YbaB
MQFNLIITALLSAQAFAFTSPSPQPSQTTALNLFGGGNKGGQAKGPGMMDQLAMFKKAQEMAQKKKELDNELSQMTFYGTSSDGKVKGTFKYIPNTNPLDPNPEYEPQNFDFDEDFFASASPDDLAAAIKEAVLNGIEETNTAVAEKYAVLQADLMAVMGGNNK